MPGRPRRDTDPFGDDGDGMRLVTGGGAVGDALRAVCLHLRREGIAQALVEDAAIVLAEVLNNIEEHAYAGRGGQPVRLDLRVCEGAVHCVVEDLGLPLPDGALPGERMPPANPATPESWPEGGFGWAIVRRLTRDLSYASEGGRNRLCFCVSGRT
ncbi:ATP-binding protein [Roseibacterium sp. SDUM158017]|uniref:ATP-binding protein n=1 Tax=Roseicyclus salinarum TaxID=3036773 RepID=UPI0024158669|nr:ATP-binding protein [Roseibacterium sp. SDUM158017]MDG4650291.1 ATP-binding protein [Roseibacterium sp. SDUM158017]